MSRTSPASAVPEDILRRRAELERYGQDMARWAPAMQSEVTGLLRAGRLHLPTLTVTPPSPDSLQPHIFVHGGAWCLGSSQAFLGLLRRMAFQCRRPIVSLDYPLAPEHPYPAAIDATFEALSLLGSDRGVAGLIAGSAGAHIALAAAMRLRAAGPSVQPRAMLLWNPAVTLHSDIWSHAAFGTGHGLESSWMDEAYRLYDVPPTDPHNDLAAMDLSDLPPVWIACGDRDPLMADSLRTFARLASQGADAHLEVIPGAVHGFMNRWFDNPRADAAVTDALDWLEARTSPAQDGRNVGSR